MQKLLSGDSSFNFFVYFVKFAKEKRLYMKARILILLLLFLAGPAFSQNMEGQQFSLPQIPDSLRTVEERFHYVVKNYWQSFSFTDTSYLQTGKRAVEEALVNYTDLLSRLPLEKSGEYLKEFLRKSSANAGVQNHMSGLLRKYLVNYDSPLRNHDLYICAAEYLKEHAPDEITRYNAMQDASLLGRNPQGAKATDFAYMLPDKTMHNMYDVAAKYTLLFFYTPGCSSCTYVTSQLKGSEIVGNMVQQGALAVLAVCTQDDTPSWRRYLEDIPNNWVNGCDKGMSLTINGVYDLRVPPVLYLLDANKKILLKDVPFAQIEEYLK